MAAHSGIWTRGITRLNLFGILEHDKVMCIIRVYMVRSFFWPFVNIFLLFIFVRVWRAFFVCLFLFISSRICLYFLVWGQRVIGLVFLVNVVGLYNEVFGLCFRSVHEWLWKCWHVYLLACEGSSPSYRVPEGLGLLWFFVDLHGSVWLVNIAFSELWLIYCRLVEAVCVGCLSFAVALLGCWAAEVWAGYSLGVWSGCFRFEGLACFGAFVDLYGYVLSLWSWCFPLFNCGFLWICVLNQVIVTFWYLTGANGLN